MVSHVANVADVYHKMEGIKAAALVGQHDQEFMGCFGIHGVF
jgi:hypothetical protein